MSYKTDEQLRIDLRRRAELTDRGQQTPCWEYTMGRDMCNYGVTSYRSVRKRVHVISWLIHKGEIPLGLHVCHHCDNPPCFNPDHLFLGTQKANREDAAKKGRLVGPYVGSKNGRAKLTAEQAEEIKRLRPCGKDTIIVAARLGVHPITIRRILKGENWT